jgi:uroporphyrinogen decarboxylase
MNRHKFLRTSLLSAGALATGKSLLAAVGENHLSITKRDRMAQWLEGKHTPGYTPAAFFLHFDNQHKLGTAAAERHIEYFRYTDMDFVKIQYEQEYQPVEFLKKPDDWSKLRPHNLDFYEPQLVAVRKIVAALKKEAMVIMTLYSPFMWAGHCASRPVLRRHMEEDPEAVKRGLDILTESQLLFVNACVKIGVDGFYMSTQGSETGQFSDPQLFTRYVKPSDLVAMESVSSSCPFNILHVCDYNAPYHNYDVVADYPGQVVNCNPRLDDKELSWEQISETFNRPNMGGLDRHGILTNGTPEQIEAEVRRVLRHAPAQFILGADCTVPGEMAWSRLRHAISVAHNH